MYIIRVKYKKKEGVKVVVIGSNDKLGSIMTFSKVMKMNSNNLLINYK